VLRLQLPGRAGACTEPAMPPAAILVTHQLIHLIPLSD
jgi:hypothetical protein